MLELKDSRPLVLIVDDDQAVRESLADVMEAFGFRIATASNGREGLAAADAKRPSAIITDIEMPDMDGIELLTALSSSKSQIPVVAMSGGLATHALSVARRLGAAATFTKPLALLDVIDTVSGLASRRAA